MSFIKLYRAAFFTGILVGTSYAPFPGWALLFCYVPLWLFVTENQRSYREIFWAGWVAQFVLTLIGFHWVAYVTHEFGHIPWPLALPVLLVFCALVHLYIPLSHMLAVWLGRKWRLPRTTVFLLLPFSLNLFERFWPSLFPWNLGYSFYSTGLPIYQWADTIGFLGLSLLILLANAGFAIWWLQKKSWILPAAIVGLFLVFNLGGYFHGKSWETTDQEIKALIVQANIGNFEKVQAEKGQDFQEEIIDRFLNLSRKGVGEFPETELLVWPETAFPYYLDASYMHTYYPQKLAQGLRSLNRALITGSYSKEAIGPHQKPVSYNAVAFLNEVAEPMAPLYRKTHLLAYGEYIPFSETFPFLLKIIPNTGNFGRGTGPNSFRLPIRGQDIHWGPQICYEGLYPEFSRGLVEKGAQILVNVTNDSWFGYPFEPRQHLYMTFARAIETRRPLIRATNTGISSVVLASGKILEKSPIHTEWTGFYKIPYLQNPPLTFFSKWGHLDSIIVAVLLVAVLLIGYQNARSRRS